MQFRLRDLFTFTTICGILATFAGILGRHWDLRSYYIGFYGRGPIPRWATGSGADDLSRSLGELMGLVWSFGPWVGLFGVAAILGGVALKWKGGSQ